MSSPTKISAHRYHDFSTGHRVVGHESKCRHLHGHNYRVHFYCQAQELDEVGRVIDFTCIKELLCEWVEENWDHKFLAAVDDPVMCCIADLIMSETEHQDTLHTVDIMEGSIVWTPFNPTAENMAQYLLEVIGPVQLTGTGVTLTKVVIEETRKCAVTCEA